MDVVVARVGRPRGLRGEVTLDVRTDSPDRRLAPGAAFSTDPPDAGPLTLAAVRRDGRRWFATFAEASDRTAAEALCGVALLTAADAEPNAWYPHELAGLDVVLADGTHVGSCEGIEFLPAQDALRVAQADGTTALVPLIEAFVPNVDLESGRIVLDPPAGLVAALPAADGPPR